MLKNVKSVLNTSTVRLSMLTTVSTVINGVLGAGFYFLLARFLHPAQYGLFALCITIITLLADIADFGSNQALVRFIPAYKSDVKKQNQVISLILSIKLVSGGLIALMTVILAGFISEQFLGRAELRPMMPLIGIGVLAQLLFSFSTSISQARERFWTWSGLFIATNAARIILIIVLFGWGLLSGTTSTMVYVALPLMGFMVSLFVNRIRFAPSDMSRLNLPQILNFNGWTTAMIVVAAIGARVDTLLTGKLISLSAVGVYALANQVVAILPQLTAAIGAVTSVRYSSFDTLEKNISYTIKATWLTFAVAVLSSLVLIPLGLLIFKFSGVEYLSGIGPMMVLLVAMCVFLVTSPIRDSILYFFSKPQFFFWAGLIHLGQTVVLSYYLIPKYQLAGSAAALLLGQVLLAAICVSYYFYLCKKKKSA